MVKNNRFWQAGNPGIKRLQSFVGFTLFGGFMVVLPFVIFIFLLEWLFDFITGMTSPVSQLLVNLTPLPKYIADLLGVVIVLCCFFAIGLLIKTNVGRIVHKRMDAWLTKIAPGYKTIREIISQLLGGESNASLLKGQVCRAYLMGRAAGVSVTGIITAIHANGDFTVYVATAPIPTSGFVYHLSADCVDLLPHVSVESAMRTVIACGSGSHTIFEPPSEGLSQDRSANAPSPAMASATTSGARLAPVKTIDEDFSGSI